MPEYTLNTRNIPLYDQWDVIVVGGGPAGCTAATAAAREGAKTLLIEATGALGGMGTMGLVPAWCPFTDQEKIIYKGLAEKVFLTCKEQIPHIPKNQNDWVAIDPELLKKVYDDMVTGAGADILFHTQLSAVETDDNGNVVAVIVSNKSGLTAYSAKTYIDCTGDGDLAAWAGAEFHKGDDVTGEMQSGTLCFSLGNVDEYGYTYSPDLHFGNNPKSCIVDILESGKYPDLVDRHLCNNLIAPRTVGFNAGHVYGVDNTIPQSSSAAMITGRKMAWAYKNALAEYQPQSFANAFVAQTAPLMGIRETRRIVGDYSLTGEDYIERRSFDDEVCRNCYYIDMHQSPSEKGKDEKELESSRPARYNPGESFGIPYRCLTPKGLNNVLVAGRSISCDRVAQASVRIMPVCLTTGEAAGIAAAMATEGDVRKIDVQDLRRRLKEYGAYIK